MCRYNNWHLQKCQKYASTCYKHHVDNPSEANSGIWSGNMVGGHMGRSRNSAKKNEKVHTWTQP